MRRWRWSMADTGIIRPAEGVAFDSHIPVLIVGAWQADSGVPDVGAAYVFRLIDDQWVEDIKLEPADGGFEDEFGYSVSIQGDLAAVGVDFNDIFSGIGSRGFHHGKQNFIQHQPGHDQVIGGVDQAIGRTEWREVPVRIDRIGSICMARHQDGE